MDETFLRRAVALAADNVAAGEGGPFGAVIVKDGQIIAEARNQVVAHHDPTAHAEIQAIRLACERTGHFHLTGCTLYASSEPCPMCLAAAYWARVDRIVFANTIAEAAAIGFCDADLYGEMGKAHLDRALPICHLPLEESLAPMRAWLAKGDRVGY